MPSEVEVYDKVRRLGRARAVDLTQKMAKEDPIRCAEYSAILNRLYRKGYLKKERKGISVYYSIRE